MKWFILFLILALCTPIMAITCLLISFKFTERAHRVAIIIFSIMSLTIIAGLLSFYIGIPMIGTAFSGEKPTYPNYFLTGFSFLIIGIYFIGSVFCLHPFLSWTLSKKIGFYLQIILLPFLLILTWHLIEISKEGLDTKEIFIPIGISIFCYVLLWLRLMRQKEDLVKANNSSSP